MRCVMKEEVFAQGFGFKKAFLLFVVGCLIGNYYEQILNLITHYIADGSIFWEFRRGVIYGPFSPIYGAGAVLFVYLLTRREISNFKTFLYGSLIGGSFEYLVSLFQEIFVGTTSWDYSNYFLNIHGRTTIPYMMVWGLAAFFLVKIFYPWFSRMIEKIPCKIGNVVYKGLLIFLVLDMAISWTALLRQNLRRKNIPPFTVVGELYDVIYPDDVLHHYFPNMVVSE